MQVVLHVLKLSIFVVQKLALHQNGVKFRQLSISDIIISLATLYDIMRHRLTESKFLVYIPLELWGGLTSMGMHKSHLWRQARCLKN